MKSDGVTYDSRMGISVKAYDAADRLISDTDIYGNVTQYAYDATGNLIQTTDHKRACYDLPIRRYEPANGGNRCERLQIADSL